MPPMTMAASALQGAFDGTPPPRTMRRSRWARSADRSIREKRADARERADPPSAHGPVDPTDRGRHHCRCEERDARDRDDRIERGEKCVHARSDRGRWMQQVLLYLIRASRAERTKYSGLTLVGCAGTVHPALAPSLRPPPNAMNLERAYLVTGGAGFIGSAVVRTLLRATPAAS